MNDSAVVVVGLTCLVVDDIVEGGSIGGGLSAFVAVPFGRRPDGGADEAKE